MELRSHIEEKMAKLTELRHTKQPSTGTTLAEEFKTNLMFVAMNKNDPSQALKWGLSQLA